MTPVETVLFDLWDTLAWVPHDTFARGPLARRTGVDPEELSRAWAGTRDGRGRGVYGSLEGDIAAVLELCGVTVPGDELTELAHEQERVFAGAVRSFEDTPGTLRELRGQGLRLGVVSNCSIETRGIVAELGLDETTDAVVLSFEVGVRKPDRRIFRTALERLGAGPATTLFVDDIAEYLDGGRAIGMRTVHIVRDGYRRDPGKGHPRIATLEELAPHLAG